jgi:hypothetical protein
MRRWGGIPRAEALAGTFKAQEVANTVWAYATMGRGPGTGLMRALEGLAEALAGTLKAQEVANTLWAYALKGRRGRTTWSDNVANTLWAYATMGRRGGMQLAHTPCGHTLHSLWS